ncbi:bifunctional pyr operon transcriptional regulator/uracil phosphoribosyltransferase PyrR [Chondrinema litorale]|uniref:bifunctional pyr operon transcriptional regulator/uracil phosphoribosyltransferase PyrR n=1 Tax=Chondrinema litorale TaxID=2994555 RepID=UPI0025438E7F|nr:bifunctional pyr operon transcriptional regulator/uracil phosphoribosyltransferase PyrR [Chondrinema litorale]UZR94385.1 bifunctional pyr operon transcriptional regulator/uracil phosphoribosyltransferase PyrR [Chondrinema litorale]
MAKIKLLSSKLLDIMLSRLCQQLIENHIDFNDSVLLGMQPRGVFLAKRIKERLSEMINVDVPVGSLDTTFYRDDFRRRDEPLSPNSTHVPFIIENKKVILVDDVLYTGRTVRAAISAMLAFGRPSKVELFVLVNRKYSRHLPIEPNYVGKSVNTIQSQRVVVEWIEQGFDEDNIWLFNQWQG